MAMLAKGEYIATPPTLVDGQYENLQLDANGYLRVNVVGMVANVDLDIEASDLGAAAEGAALGNGVLIQGDDGTDRTNVLVDTAGHVQVDEQNSTAIKTAVETIDNAISGSEMQVDVVGALPTGANAIGKLAANSGVDIGDVTLTEGTKTLLKARVALTASQTGATVLDPTTSTKFVLKKLVVSCSTAGTVQFFDETNASGTAIGPILSLAANGGYAENWDFDYPYRSAAVNNVLKYTTDTLAGSVYIEYWEE